MPDGKRVDSAPRIFSEEEDLIDVHLSSELQATKETPAAEVQAA